ncbi:hypothetical protein LR48_Vigan03g206200 [Vigna angularis]|uniref:Uncharacterized protein n=1 Tax=Phaseolus angularis TaxID=3914 RepID=A0A0L9U7A4_PHAAN|nr:hypothetical protein LR48_Vigan03g206200 [Vigna angularis]
MVALQVAEEDYLARNGETFSKNQMVESEYMPALEPITLVEKENEVDYQNNQHVDSVIHHSESHQNFTVAENMYHNDQHMDCGCEDPENDAAKKNDRNEVQFKKVPADSAMACQFNKDCDTPC